MSNYQQADAVILALLRGEPQPRTRSWLRATEHFPCLELRYSVRDPASGITGPCHVTVAELHDGTVRALLPSAYPSEVSPRRALAVFNRIAGAALVCGVPFVGAERMNGD